MANKIKHPKKRAFLAAYAKCGNVSQACELSKVSRFAHYNWLQVDPEYAEAFDDAKEQAADFLEQAAWKRATQGIKKPVFYQGEECGVVNEYSDTLLIFLLKGARPDKYAERNKNEVTGKDGGPVAITDSRFAGMTEAELEAQAKSLIGGSN